MLCMRYTAYILNTHTRLLSVLSMLIGSQFYLRTVSWVNEGRKASKWKSKLERNIPRWQDGEGGAALMLSYRRVEK